uniref:Uncharacterized protein n=11 Tax=Nymphaea colorata TaxID=210225 RepID=A0A5K1GJV5_9MAGN
MLSEAIILSLKEMNIGSTSEDPMSASSEDPCQTDDSPSAGRSTSPTEGPSFEGTAGDSCIDSLVVCQPELKTLSHPKSSVTTVHAEPPSVTDCQTLDPVLSKSSSLPASESQAEQLKSSSTGCLCNGDLSAQQQHLDQPADANALLPKNM